MPFNVNLFAKSDYKIPLLITMEFSEKEMATYSLSM